MAMTMKCLRLHFCLLQGRGLRDIGILETFVHLQKIDISHNEIEGTFIKDILWQLPCI